MNALVFMDTETTGLSLDDDIWEFAAIRRDEDGTETELHLFIEHNDLKCRRLPDSFRADHATRYPSPCSGRTSTRKDACYQIAGLFGDDRPHVVGAVPNFDTERLSQMIRGEWPNWPKSEFWHYHLIDVENLAVGFVAGVGARALDEAAVCGEQPPTIDFSRLAPPWNSDDLSRACGIEPPTTERHTAMGDVRWAMAVYDRIMSAES